MAQKFRTSGFKTSSNTNAYQSNADKAYRAYADHYNNGIKTSQPTADYYSRLTDLQKQSAKLPSSFEYGNQQELSNSLKNLAQREPFKYDLSSDTLYNQAKQQYQQQGRQAMADTVGAAAAQTGGYGNSYAATAGSQAYQGFLQQLNNNIADYYNLAMNAYNSETDRLSNVFNAYSTDMANQQNSWLSNWEVANQRFNYLYNAYNQSRNYDLNAYTTEADILGNAANLSYSKYNDAFNHDVDLWKQKSANQLNLQEMAENARQFDANYLENQRQFNENLKENQRQYNKSLAETKRSNAADEVIRLASAAAKTTTGSTGNGTAGTAVKSSDISRVQQGAKGLANDPTALYNYLNNLGEAFDPYMADILAAIGKPSTFLEDYENGKYSVKQK